jgi:hypothetical protein
MIILYILYDIIKKRGFNKKDKNKDIRTLHLVLFSHDNNGPYESMYSMLSNYYKQFLPKVKTIFYCFSPDISSPYELKDDILKIQGKETYVPGILDKTIHALEYFKTDIEKEYDFVVRSNISTIVNFHVLLPLMAVNPSLEYGGGILNTLGWLDEKGGVKDETWFGTQYASGTSIILSKWVAIDLMQRKHLIRREFVDDLAIGVFIREHRPDIVPQSLPQEAYIFVPNVKGDKKALETMVERGQYAFYRNHNGDREIDKEQMQTILFNLFNLFKKG